MYFTAPRYASPSQEEDKCPQERLSQGGEDASFPGFKTY
jgi:hypothetical protein